MITFKGLKNLPVETKSGTRLGRVVDVEIDEGSHAVITYVVQPGRISRPLVRTPLRINRAQVLSITAERMVVDDATSGSAERVRAGLAKQAIPAVPA